MKKKLLITGAAGFIGHHVVEAVLKDTDWEVVMLDCLSYAGSLNRLTDIDLWDKERKRVKFIYHDLRAPISETIHKMIGKVDYVWHLAAESDVGRSLENSIPFVMSNVVGTANLLEYMKDKQKEVERIIIFSTDEIYGPAPEDVYYKEGDPHNPSNPYSASKSGEEAVAKAFAFSFGLPITITNTMNVIGERQHPEKFLPKTVKSILSREPVTIHGTPGEISSRCWIHAREVANALFYLNKRGEFIRKDKQDQPGYGIYNIVGEEEDAKWIADEIAKTIGEEPKFEYIDFHSTRPGHDLRYALSGDKLKKMGFNYTYSLKDSLARTVRWMIRAENRKWLNL